MGWRLRSGGPVGGSGGGKVASWASSSLRIPLVGAVLLTAVSVGPASGTPEPPMVVSPADHQTQAAGQVEGRPAAGEASPLQARIDAAAAGDTIVVEPGEYRGDLVLDKPLTLLGQGRARLLGSGRGSVVRIRAAGVTLEGFEIDGQGGGDLGRDSSGIHTSAPGTVIRGCQISGSLFGIYLREANGCVVERCSIRGIRGRDAGEKGSGIHVWNTRGFTLSGNELVDVRDGLYIQSSSEGAIRDNRVRDMRYGIHYMFSDDNVFEDNTFENGAAGAALMYSRRIAFRRNRFLRNRGFASVGLLFKACDDVVAEDNLIADNARGIFLEGSTRNLFQRNVVAGADSALVIYDSSADNRFLGNSFVGNMTPLTLSGTHTDTLFRGNYWSENHEPDLDGDGRSDRPYRLSSVFDHFRSNLTAADLFSDGFAGMALGAAERAFPVLQAVPVVDDAPLVQPPVLADVPLPPAPTARAHLLGLVGSLVGLVLGVGVLLRGSGVLA
jgi:nitrous oxidase accessory protein